MHKPYISDGTMLIKEEKGASKFYYIYFCQKFDPDEPEIIEKIEIKELNKP